MAISYVSSATVRVMVSFYPVGTDDTCSSSARNSVIHKEKFNVPLSGDAHNDLFNFIKHLKTFSGLAEIAKSKCLGENSKVTIASFIILRYTKLFLFSQEPSKNTHKLRILLGQSTVYLLALVEIRF